MRATFLPRLITAAFCVTLLALAGCEINKPEMPTFETAVSVPLGLETILIMDAIEDEDYLVVDGNGGLSFNIEGEPDTVSFDLDLAADFDAQSVDQGLGNFELADLDPLAYTFILSDIWAPAAPLVNQPAIVPPFPIDVASAGQDLPDIDAAVLAAGTAAITVTNGLPVPVSAASGPDQIVLTLQNPADGAVLATFIFPEIPAGGADTQTADLAGVTLPGTVGVRIVGGSPGSGVSLVNVSGTDAIDVSALFTDLLVSSATAAVDAQSFTSSFSTALPADYEITQAEISSGGTVLDLTNNLPIACTASLSWPNLVDPSGTPLSRSYDLAPGSSSSHVLSFAGYRIEAGGAPLTEIPADIVISTDGSGGAPVTMSAGDGLTANLGAGRLVFGSVTGVVPAHSVALDPIETTLDLPDELDGIQLTAATLVLELNNTADLPADLDLVLSGAAQDGSVQTLVINQQLESNAATRGTSSIVLNEANSTIVDFINNLPERVTLTGSIVIGGDGSLGTVRPGDYAVIGYRISAPAEVIITGATLAGDPEPLDLDADTRDIIADHALGALVQTEILNHMPVAVELLILAGTDPNTVRTHPELVIGPLTVAAAQTDPVTHQVSQGVLSRPVFTLDRDAARLLSQAGLHTVIEVVLPASDGTPVRMMSTDYLEVRGMITLDVEVNDQW